MKARIILILWIAALIMLPLTASGNFNTIASSNDTQFYGRLAVVVIIDGLEPTIIPTLNLPTLSSLSSEGVYTLNAKTVLPSVTTVAHAALATGAYPETNGIANTLVINSSNWHLSTSDTPEVIYVPDHLSEVRQVPSLISIATQDGVDTILIVGKEKLSVMGPVGAFYTLPTNYTEYNTYEPYDPQFPLDLRLMQDEWIINQSLSCLDRVESKLKLGERVLMVINLPATDWAGHAYGPNSTEYNQIVQNADIQIGRLVSAIKEKNLWSHTLFIVTSDHGFSDTDPAKTAMTIKIRWSAITVDHYAIEVGGRAMFIYLKDPSDLEKAVEDAWDSGIVKEIYSRWTTTSVNGTLSDIHLNTTFAGDLYVVLKDGYTAYTESEGSHGGTDEQAIPLYIAGWNVKSTFNLSNAEIIDIMPTVLAYLGVHIPSTVDGDVLYAFTEPFGDITLSVSNLLPEENELVSINVTFLVNSTGSLNLTIIVGIIDQNGTLINTTYITHAEELIENNIGITSLTYKFEKDGTYYIVASLISDSNFIASTSKKVVVIPVTEAELPWPQIIAAVVIAIVLGVAVLIIPFKFKEKF